MKVKQELVRWLWWGTSPRNLVSECALSVCAEHSLGRVAKTFRIIEQILIALKGGG